MASDNSQAEVRQAAQPLTGSAGDYDRLLELIGDASLVLLGEASHGTHEFYRERARITRQLIERKGFAAVAVEADWPDAYRVNRFVLGESADRTAAEALQDFRRFPAWMWRNADILDFIGWLRNYNQNLPARSERAGFYGLDLYSLHASIEAVLGYLSRMDPEAARRARARYSCFDHFSGDSQAYGYSASLGLDASCEKEVVAQLVELRRSAGKYAGTNGRMAADEFFFAEQNARLVKNAEKYYRSMFHSHVASWNLRDRHMADTLEALRSHLNASGMSPKIVVWAHNSHLGDARATEMGESGEHNVGQLVRQQHGNQAVLVGFSTYSGTVTAASEWGAPAERKRVRPALEQSYEALFHSATLPRFLLPLRGQNPPDWAAQPRLQRAIGVVYKPESERASHYLYVRLREQFDAVLHFDHTRAVEPLEPGPGWMADEPPETFPSGL